MKNIIEEIVEQFYKEMVIVKGGGRIGLSDPIPPYDELISQDPETYVNFLRSSIQKAINAYGGKCKCCGEKEPKFLAIDHINGNGNKHRKEIKGTIIYLWLKKNNYPSGFQILCHNCNMAKAFWGICPHKQ